MVNFFSISIFPNVKISLLIFIYDNKFFMFYNAPMFLVKSAFCIKFMASFVLIKLIMKRESEPLMFKIAISLRFIDIINKSCHLLQTFG